MTMQLRFAQAILAEPKYVEARKVVEEYEAELKAKAEDQNPDLPELVADEKLED